MRLTFRRAGITAADTFEDVLARCLASIEDGSTDIAACLSAHPVHAVRLEPALRTAAALRVALSAEPDPAFVPRARARMLAAANGLRPLAPTPAPAAPRARVQVFVPLVRPLMAAAVAAIVVLMIGLPAAAATSNEALPGDWNYSVKRTAEQVRLVLTPSEDDRLDFHLTLAERRAQELARLIELRRDERKIESASSAYQQELTKATEPLRAQALPSVNEARKIEIRVQKQQELLDAAIQKQEVASAAVVPAPRRVIPSPDGTVAPEAAPDPLNPDAALTATPETPPTTRTGSEPSLAALQAAQSAYNAATRTRDLAVDVARRAEVAEAATTQRAGTATQGQVVRRTPTPAPASSSTTPAGSVTTTPEGRESRASRRESPDATPTPASEPSPGPSVAAFASPSASPTASVAPSPPSASSAAVRNAATTSPPTVAPSRTSTTVAAAPPVSSTPVLPSTADLATPAAAPTTPADITTSRRTPTTTPAPVATATPIATPARSVAAFPTPTPTPERTTTMTIAAGPYQFFYAGEPQFIDVVLEKFAGKYAWAQFTPLGGLQMVYIPGRSTNRPIVTPRSTITLLLTEPVTLSGR